MIYYFRLHEFWSTLFSASSPHILLFFDLKKLSNDLDNILKITIKKLMMYIKFKLLIVIF